MDVGVGARISGTPTLDARALEQVARCWARLGMKGAHGRYVAVQHEDGRGAADLWMCWQLWEKPFDSGGNEKLVFKTSTDLVTHDRSADGSLLLHGDIDPKIRRQDISVLLMRGVRGEPPKATTFVHTAFDENMARFSPDGRWVAYQSDESGRHEIYVRPIGSDSAVGAGK